MLLTMFPLRLPPPEAPLTVSHVVKDATISASRCGITSLGFVQQALGEREDVEVACGPGQGQLARANLPSLRSAHEIIGVVTTHRLRAVAAVVGQIVLRLYI